MTDTGKWAWVPLTIIYVLTFFYLNLYHTASSQYSLRQICLDLSLPADCSTPEALKQSAAFGVPSLLIPGIASVIFVGVWGAIAPRLGRKVTLAVGILGQTFTSAGWTLVFFFPEQLKAHWKILVIGGSTLQGCCGGILILYLSIFAIVGDISAKAPSLRTRLYVLFDLMAGIAGVGGSQAAGFLMSRDSRWLLGVTSVGMLLNILVVLLIIPETLEESVRSQPIDIKKANTLGQLAFLLPLKSTKQMLEKDHEKIYSKINQLYNEQILKTSTTTQYISPNLVNLTLDDYDGAYKSPTNDRDVDITDQLTSPHHNNPAQGFGSTLSTQSLEPSQSHINQLKFDLTPGYGDDDAMLLGIAAEAAAAGVYNMPITFDELAYANGINNTVMHDSPALLSMQGSPSTLSSISGDVAPSPVLLPSSRSTVTEFNNEFSLDGSKRDAGNREALLKDDERSDDNTNASTRTTKTKSKSKSNKEKVDHRGVPLLVLSQPPRRISHGNSMLMLVLCLFFVVLNFLGYSVVIFYYLKKLFNINSRQFSNVVSISALVRGLGAFVIFPIFKKFIQTPTGEKYFLSFLVLVQAIVFGLLTFCKSYFQFACVLVLYYLANTFPSGLVRSLMANQVSQQLQHYVLGSIAAAEVFVFVFGGVGYNYLWLLTQNENPHIILWIWSGISVFASLLPFFISDSREDFDLRIEMTTQYTKIRTAEKKYEEEQKAKKAKEVQEQQHSMVDSYGNINHVSDNSVLLSLNNVGNQDDYLMDQGAYSEAI